MQHIPSANNTNCDGSGPHLSGEVRRYPLHDDSAAILCRACFDRLARERRDNVTWESAEVYA